MALHNKDYYTGMSDELATELLGVREAHASFKELAELIKTRRERIEELKKLISQKKSASIKAEVALKKAAKAAEEGGKKFTDGELKAKEYEELVSAAKKAEDHAAKLGNSISKLEKELKELEAEESAWLKTEEKLTTKQRRALKKAMAAAKAEEPEPDDSDEEGEWDDLKGRKTDEELAKELDDLFSEDGEDNPAVKEKDPEFQAAMDKFLKAMGDSDDEDEDDEDDSDAKNADEDETGDSSDADDTKKPIVIAPKKESRMKMNDLAFYNGIGNDAFEYDRNNNGMSDSLRGWIESTLEDDAELAEDSILKHLGAILKKNPNLIEAVKDAIVKAEEYNMPYKTVFVSKVTGETFDKKADAEDSIEAFIKAGATTFENCFEIRHTANGAYVEESEVEAYINSFDGDRDALRRQLHMIAPAKAAKPGKGKAAKA